MKISDIILSIIIICLVLISFIIGRITTKQITNKNELDSLKNIISKKDSIIFSKEIEFKKQIQFDSLHLFSINKSINNIRYEIQKNSQSVWIVPDSLHWKYVDSIRTTKGFHKILRK